MSRYQFPASGGGLTVRELDGSPTVAATVLVLPNGTLNVSGTEATVSGIALLTANTFTAKQSFSGTTHVGLCLHSLTTAQYNAITPANGDLFVDSTTNRVDVRLNGVTEELIDTRGGQVIAGNLTASGTVTAGAGSQSLPSFSFAGDTNTGFFNNFADYITAVTAGGARALFGTTGTGSQFTATDCIGLSLNVLTTSPDCTIARVSSGVVRLGTTSALSDGTLQLANLTASSRVYAGSTNNYYDNPTSGQGRWQTPFAGLYTFQSNQSAQSMTVQLATSELKLAGLQHWDVAHANGRRLDLFSQAGVPITARPAGVLAMTWDTSGNTQVAGNLTASGTLTVGGGTVVASILSATATLNFPSIGSNGTETLTITVTGAVAGDSVFLGVPAGLDAGLIFCASVTAANTVTVRMHNSSGGSIDPASGTFRATVIRF